MRLTRKVAGAVAGAVKNAVFESLHPRARKGLPNAGEWVEVDGRMKAMGGVLDVDTGVWRVPAGKRVELDALLDEIGFETVMVPTGMRQAVDEDFERFGIPGNWTDVFVDPTPGANTIAIGYLDGKRKYHYDPDFLSANQVEKYARVRELDSKLPTFDRVVREQAGTDDTALAAWLVRTMAFRAGKQGKQLGEKESFGVTTMQRRHVNVDGDTVLFEFPSKSGQVTRLSVVDPELARFLAPRLVGKNGDDRLLNTHEKKLNAFIKNLVPGHTSKDFRTHAGTAEAIRTIEALPIPQTKEEYNDLKNQVGDRVAHKLQNTRSVALDNYVDPRVFRVWPNEESLPGWAQSNGVALDADPATLNKFQKAALTKKKNAALKHLQEKADAGEELDAGDLALMKKVSPPGAEPVLKNTVEESFPGLPEVKKAAPAGMGLDPSTVKQLGDGFGPGGDFSPGPVDPAIKKLTGDGGLTPPTGPAVDLPPPVDPVIPTVDGTSLTRVGSAGGSNGAQFHETPDGTRFLVKSYDGNSDRVANEAIANSIYQELGVPVPRGGLIDNKDGSSPSYGYQLIDGDLRPELVTPDNPDLHQGYAAHAFLANWDFVGLERDNILFDGDGKPVFLDQGGALNFRAMGEPKDFKAGFPDELYSLADQGQAKGTIGITGGEVYKQVDDLVQTMTDEKIDRIVDSVDLPEADASKLKTALKGRRDALDTWLSDPATTNDLAAVFPMGNAANKAAVSRKIKKRAPAGELTSISSRKRALSDEDAGTVKFWVEQSTGTSAARTGFNGRISGRSPNEAHDRDLEMRDKLMDLMANETLTEDIVGHRGIQSVTVDEFLQANNIKDVGDEYRDRGFFAMTVADGSETHAKNWAHGFTNAFEGMTFEVKSRKGSHALVVKEASGAEGFKHEGEVLLPPSNFRVLGIDRANRRLTVESLDPNLDPPEVGLVPGRSDMGVPEFEDRLDSFVKQLSEPALKAHKVLEASLPQINKRLIDGDPKIEAFARHFDELLQAAPKLDGESIYTAFRTSDLDSFKDGTDFSHYVGGGLSLNTLQYNAGSHTPVRIITPEGARAIPLSGPEGNPMLVLNRKLKYRRIGVDPDGTPVMEAYYD